MEMDWWKVDIKKILCENPIMPMKMKGKMFRLVNNQRHNMTRLKFKLRSWWYKLMYGVDVGLEGTMFPAYGKGKFVDIRRRGPYVDITRHTGTGSPHPAFMGTLRFIPYQPNHGFMVEVIHKDGTRGLRVILDLETIVNTLNLINYKACDEPDRDHTEEELEAMNRELVGTFFYTHCTNPYVIEAARELGIPNMPDGTSS